MLALVFTVYPSALSRFVFPTIHLPAPVHTPNLVCPILSTHICLASQDDAEGGTSGLLPILAEAGRAWFPLLPLFCL